MLGISQPLQSDLLKKIIALQGGEIFLDGCQLLMLILHVVPEDSLFPSQLSNPCRVHLEFCLGFDIGHHVTK